MAAPLSSTDLARAIDHTLLKPGASAAEIRALCEEARAHGFHSVCVNPCRVPLARRELNGSPVVVCAVAGFPLGASRKETKAREAAAAMEDGALEIDMALNVGALKDADFDTVGHDIEAVREAMAGHGLLKVILETALLTPGEIIAACRIAEGAGAQFVKTSTGFGPGGATVEAVRLMRETVGARLGVKASGGIGNRAAALAMLEAGASRLGTSRSVAIVTDTGADGAR